jgi:hypothetical protein
MKKKELTPDQILFLYRVYKEIMDGQATATNINTAYFFISPDPADENFRMTHIIKWVNDHKKFLA